MSAPRPRTPCQSPSSSTCRRRLSAGAQDANYRRLLGDLHWAHDTPFGTLCDYFPPGTALAALRTCKSGVLVGCAREQEAAATAAHPDKWLVGGLYGMVSLKAAA